MFKRQRTGSVICPSCGQLVGVRDERCLNCGRPQPGMWGFVSLLRRLGPDLSFVPIVMWSCAVLYVCTLVVDLGSIRTGGMALLAPSGRSLFLFGASGAIPVFQEGRWWSVLSAGWLHGGVLHILFNMLWVRDLAPVVAHVYGGSRAILIFTAANITGFLASSTVGHALAGLPRVLAGAPLTVGASAAVFGLLGALVYYGRRGGSSLIGDRAKGFAVVLAIFGFIFPGVDNWAHLGGFAGGYLAGRFLDPLRPERVDHVIAALACLALSAAAILVSVLTGLKYFR
jgi:rhomboid protease GluP